MNYFAHGLDFIDEPYFLAGTAVPDWLNVADRRVRVRRRHAAEFVNDPDDRLAALARGIVRHHDDDAWFHETLAFTELSWQATVVVRDALTEDDGFRPSFLGHILVEILLDAELIADDSARLERYYSAFDAIEPQLIEEAVNRMAPRSTCRLAALIPLFSRERFLSDYLDDAKLRVRLNQVMRRVRLPELPPSFVHVLGPLRDRVAARRTELLARPVSLSSS